MTDLRPYQNDAIDEIDAVIAAGKKRPLLVAPTGAGKTVIFAAIIKRAAANGQRVIVLAHRAEIIAQTSLKLSPLTGLDCIQIQRKIRNVATRSRY